MAGSGQFPLALTKIGLRSREAETTAALSAFVQSIGYIVAGSGPLLFGVLNDVTGGWRLALRVKRQDDHKPGELRAFLRNGATTLSETWSYILPTN